MSERQWIVQEQTLVAPGLGVEVKIEGCVGQSSAEQAFCALLHRGIRDHWVEMEDVYQCPSLKGASWCSLTGGMQVCVLLLRQPEASVAWRLAERSRSIEGEEGDGRAH